LENGEFERVDIPMAELPFFLCFPTFLSKDDIKDLMPAGHNPSSADGIYILSERPDIVTEKLSKYGADQILQNVDYLAFAKMLCKIALGFLIVEIGVTGWTPAVNPLILGHVDSFRGLVSSSESPVSPNQQINLGDSEKMHNITQFRGSNNLIRVRIDLFVNLSGPSYYVTAGMLGDDVKLRLAVPTNS